MTKVTSVSPKIINFKKQKQKFSGFPAQIVQHEMDHLEGKII